MAFLCQLPHPLKFSVLLENVKGVVVEDTGFFLYVM